MASVVLTSVRKEYPGHAAVRDVDLAIADGEFLVLLGPSGCGKTTLLRMIAGLESVTAGDVSIGDRVVNNVAAGDRDVAMVFQSYALYPHLTVYKNLAYGLRRRRTPKDQIRQRVGEASDLLGISHLLDRLPTQLSGGQRQRVALGRAIVRQPAVFLMDEPLSNLDAKLRVQMRTELMQLHRRLGITTVYVTHDQVEAMTMGDRIVVMNDGEIQQIGSPLELYQRPASRFVATFLGSPQMNEVLGRLRANGSGYRFDSDVWSFALPGGPGATGQAREVVLGIRPQLLWARLAPSPPGHISLGGGAVVEAVEHLGSESFVAARVRGQLVTAAIEPGLPCLVGSEREICVDPAGLMFFDADSGDAIDVTQPARERAAVENVEAATAGRGGLR